VGPEDEAAASAELEPPNLSGLANGILQQMIQPIAYGAVGLILAAPLTSAVTRIAADLARDRAETVTT
jgi:hypothetical protein